MSPDENDKLLSVKEVAEYLGVHRVTVIKHVAGKVPEVRIGRLRFWKLGDIRAWIEAQRVEPKPAASP